MNIKIGGKLGDFIHSLALCKYIFIKTNQRCNVYLCECASRGIQVKKPRALWAYSYKQTYKELYPVVTHQEYINKFELWKEGVHIDIDLSIFRQKLKHTNLNITWSNFFIRSYYDKNANFNERWIEPTKKYPNLNNVLLVNRSHYRSIGDNYVKQQYYNIINQHNTIITNSRFVCFDERNYSVFKNTFKIDIPLLLVNDIEHFVNVIGSCESFLGNLSAPHCMAVSMDKRRILEPDSDKASLLYRWESVNNPNTTIIQSYYQTTERPIAHEKDLSYTR
jgi:hypothetical protein